MVVIVQPNGAMVVGKCDTLSYHTCGLHELFSAEIAYPVGKLMASNLASIHVFLDGHASPQLLTEIIRQLHPDALQVTDLKITSLDVSPWPPDILAFAFTWMLKEGHVSGTPQQIHSRLGVQKGTAH